MKNRYLILIIGIFIGCVIMYAALDRFSKPQDPEVITVTLPAPPPFKVEVPVPVLVNVDSSSIFDMALATIDSAYIQSLVKVDTASIIDLALAQVDTAAILRAYFTTYHYEQDITDDTLFNLQLKQDISQNKVVHQKAVFSLLKNEVKYVPMASHYIYLGGVINASPTPGIGPSLNYSTEHWSFGGSYDIINKSIILQTQYKIVSWH